MIDVLTADEVRQLLKLEARHVRVRAHQFHQ
jgi:hypothetical protein